MAFLFYNKQKSIDSLTFFIRVRKSPSLNINVFSLPLYSARLLIGEDDLAFIREKYDSKFFSEYDKL